MKLIKLTLVSLFALSFSLTSFAAKTETFKKMNSGEVQKLLEAKSAPIAVFDANGEDTRKKEGTVPGAVLLTDLDGEKLVKALPKDKNTKLVFYCANEMCTASHKAAKAAAKAGYPDVAVMTDGIAGWKKAGLKVSTVN